MTKVLMLFAGLALAAQQPVYKAPTPADWAAMAKLPDFSGVWERGTVGTGGNSNPAFGPQPTRGSQPAAGNAGAAPQRGAGGGQRAAGGARGGRAGGANRVGGGANTRPLGPSFTPEYEAKRVAAARAPQAEDNTTANCLPPGMPGIMTQPYPMEFLLTPGKVTIVIEAYTEVRHIYTDGRKLPEDPDPNFFGTSVGHWEGDTLVVETVGFNDHVELAKGVPHSDKMKIEEKFKLTDPDTMAYQTTITDPEALTQPYVTNATLRRHRNWTISEYICEENNRNYVDQNGKAGINLNLPAAPKKD